MKMQKGSPKEINALIKLANNDLENAINNSKDGFYRQAVVSSYYVVLDVARAILLDMGYTPKSHQGVFKMLGLHLIKKDLLPKIYSRKINELFENRLSANYDAQQDFFQDDAKEAISFAEEFYEKILKLIKK